MHGVFQSIQARDERDINRAVSPLKPAKDAFVIDSTDMGIKDVLGMIKAIVTEKIG
jgi:cytidylate kinase